MVFSVLPTPAPDERADHLVRTRRLKMARSAHAYVRGATAKFYDWLDAAGGKLPEGPDIWICGDCHVGNLGPLADADGRVEVQIRDLDQTVIGNPAHDLIRLGLSLASAARGADLPGVVTARMIERLVDGYAEGLAGNAGPPGGADKPKIVKRLLREAASRKWRHLAAERIENVEPTIPLGKTFWALSDQERAELEGLFDEEAVCGMVTALNGRESADELKILDAAYWVKGCSSLGRLRYAVLVGIYGGGTRKLCLVDIKEGTTAAAPRSGTARMPRDNAERVVAGARALSPHLGERMLASRLLDRSIVLRELMPQDLKLRAEQLARDEAVSIARYLAGIVGRAHGRQMDDATRRGWQAELARNRSKTLDAPSWLWTSVVELVATHEAAYLDHCRRYALGEAA